MKKRRINHRWYYGFAALLAVLLVWWPDRLNARVVCGDACPSCSSCSSCCPSCSTSCPTCCPTCCPTTCTIRVPQWFTEYRTKCVTRYRPETRERQVTVYRDVPTPQTVEEQYTVMVPKTRMRTVCETVYRPVCGDIELRKTTWTPQVEAREATYTVTQMVPERTVSECASNCCQTSSTCCQTCGLTANSSPSPPSSSSVEEPVALPPAPRNGKSTPSDKAAMNGGAESPRGNATASPPANGGCTACNSCYNACGSCGDACGACAPCKACTTCWKPVCRQEKCEYPVTSMEPCSRVERVSFYELRPEQRLREEQYVVEVPETRTRTCEITVMKTVAEQRAEQYTVMVPYEEHIQVPVCVCREVERTVVR